MSIHLPPKVRTVYLAFTDDEGNFFPKEEHDFIEFEWPRGCSWSAREVLLACKARDYVLKSVPLFNNRGWCVTVVSRAGYWMTLPLVYIVSTGNHENL